MMRNKIILFLTALTFCAVGVTVYTVYEKATISEIEATLLANVEALTSNELEGWVKGRKMNQRWIESSTTVGGSVGIGEIKVEGGITSMRVSCCVQGHAADLCNKKKEHSECENQLP